jgi:hypothetical protein
MRITLHDWRWPYAAARASMYLLLLTTLGSGDPAASFTNVAHARSARPIQIHRRDLIVAPEDAEVIAGASWFRYDDLATELTWLRAHNRGTHLILRVDRNAPFVRVRKIVRAAQTAGFHRLTIDLQARTPLLMRRLNAGFAIDADSLQLVERPKVEEGGFQLSTTCMWE